MIKLAMAEIKWLKGFNPIELAKYLNDFPERSDTTFEFKRRYTWVRGKWKRN